MIIFSLEVKQDSRLCFLGGIYSPTKLFSFNKISKDSHLIDLIVLGIIFFNSRSSRTMDIIIHARCALFSGEDIAHSFVILPEWVAASVHFAVKRIFTGTETLCFYSFCLMDFTSSAILTEFLFFFPFSLSLCSVTW